MLPPPVERALITLGEHLYIARKRRKQTLSSFADRMQVSVPTLRKMERGDPTVSISVYAMALWLIGRVQFLAEIANPVSDEMALLLELRNLSTQQKGTSR
ncbi:putative Transcriptional regulator, XRE family [Candidatus Glomeribacter gigasporarum BEG34]|uniref:Putative Transcriptional regulator, XRE family n=1 Tax=Candidatus Glomeribacter gigasporarum BEG34 TaxID=1070319 RepID=G2J7T3_9BURK|nr:putative Transcriptional regulator, XRE family [Candidatus Glomeribacter gigasporarum BEG34]